MSAPRARERCLASRQPIPSAAFWRCYLVTARPYLFFVSGAAGLVGLALSPDLGWGPRTAAFAVFFVVYGLGQALTDVSQTDTDALSAPYRPLVRGLVTGPQVTAVSLVGLGLCAAVLASLNPWTLSLAAAAVAGLWTYTSAKRRWWAGPCYNAWIVALLPAIGFLCDGSSFDAALASRRLLAAMVSVFSSYGTFVVLGYLKDISADRATGYVTLPVRFGWKKTIAVGAAFTALAFAASAALVALSWRSAHALGPSAVVALGLWLAGAAALVVAHVGLLGVDCETQAHRGIGWSVRGFVLLHLGEAAVVLPPLSWLAVVLYALFELALALRPERSQI